MNVPSHNLAVVESEGFAAFNLSPFLAKTIETVGYVKPTPIQAQAIPLLLQGHDLIGLAQTGTGKTAAFVLPLLQKLSGAKGRGSKVLVLAPTRELAEQIRDVVTLLAPRTGVKSCTVYGGVSHQRQIRDLEQRPEIIVACPGRLLDHMRGRTVDLSTVEYLVLDEADRMLDMGFLPDIKKIIAKLPEDRQTMLFSATMPREIEALSREVLRDPQIVRVNLEAPVAAVTHAQLHVQAAAKLETLTSWLHEHPESLVVVFTKMKHTAKKISEKLARCGYDATSLHGNLSQAKRLQALNGFRKGEYRIMVATDIAARGIDVDGVTHVINYDMPDTLDAYIHRTGRAGRASRAGDAIAFVTREDRGMVRAIEKWLGSALTVMNPQTIIAGEEVERADNQDGGEKPVRRNRERSDSSRERSSRGPRRNAISSRERSGRGRGERSSDTRARGERNGERRDGLNAESRATRSGPRRERDFGARAPRFERSDTRGANRTNAQMDDQNDNRGNSREWKEWDEKRFSNDWNERRYGGQGGRSYGRRGGADRTERNVQGQDRDASQRQRSPRSSERTYGQGGGSSPRRSNRHSGAFARGESASRFEERAPRNEGAGRARSGEERGYAGRGERSRTGEERPERQPGRRGAHTAHRAGERSFRGKPQRSR